MTRKNKRKESQQLGLDDDNPTVSTIPVESSDVHGSPEDTTEGEVRKNRRRRRKNRDSDATEYAEDAVAKNMEMLESDIVMVTNTSPRGKSVDFQNVIMQSTRVGKVFVESGNCFKAVDHFNNPTNLQNEHATYESSTEEKLLDLAVSTDRWMFKFALVCRGLLGGMALCQIILTLQTSPHKSWGFFVEHSSSHLPIFYSCWTFLLIVSTVSALDRFNIKTLREKGFWIIFDARFLSALIYTVSLCIMLSIHGIQEKIIFYTHNNNTAIENQNVNLYEMEIWQISILAISIAALIVWLLQGISLNPDDVPMYLKP